MVKVGLVDDYRVDLEKLEAIVTRMQDVEIVFSTDSAEEAYRRVKNGDIDLLLADIEMPHISGYELADLIKSHSLDVDVIFVTGHGGYAVHAFDLNVHDYIMKPYYAERLAASFDRYLKKKTETSLNGRILIKQKSEMHVLQKKDIIFAERTGRSTTIVTTAEEVQTYQTLNDIKGDLPEKDFLRSHRSFIINIHYIKHFSAYTKHSFTVSFEGTSKKAMITKQQLDYFQNYYF
ncbi:MULTISPECIES: two-component system response regulator NatR [Bacillus]|uniref:two-component system response regulator NatR n=1 Tax=Bacillus TaxID=1386 RepID=UPI000A33F552|nr:two-component system response regulator NatR [Bacillus subtilis]MBU8614006.1 two-component system response regulator NatR [Bacillus subtilis]MBU8719975.1 two-component system response regulator NatR [Bacillus subtilis]MDY7216437.1 two-component system response regulator NatR [Bacillus subtilis]QUG78271.1 two-component system response regulator NatR [Bacillus subtilis]TWG53041.1 LytTR family two component transcriptional regulator [Bacillus subtilis J23]